MGIELALILIIGTVNGAVFGTLIGCLIAWFRSIEYSTRGRF